MNALTVPNETEWDLMLKQANTLLKSNFLPNAIKTPEQAVTIMMTGRELGIPPITALNNIHVIQGKPTVAPALMLAKARETKELEDLKVDYQDDGTCQVSVKRKEQSWYVTLFGPKEAQAMGLANKDNYRKQAKVMFKWRALSDALRVVFADVLCGVYTHEEMDPNAKYDDQGQFVEIKPERTLADPEIYDMAQKGAEIRAKALEAIEGNPYEICNDTTPPAALSVEEKRKRIGSVLMRASQDDVDEAKKMLKDMFGVESRGDLKGKELNTAYKQTQELAADALAYEHEKETANA